MEDKKIIEAKEVRETQNGTVKDTVQEVTVEITDGDYIGEEFTTDYVLSYDIEGKILAYELDEGDKVSVQIIEDESGNISATVTDVVRANYIFVMFGLFLLTSFSTGSIIMLMHKTRWNSFEFVLLCTEFTVLF